MKCSTSHYSDSILNSATPKKFVSVLACLVLLTTSALADSIWSAAVSGDWDDASNWSNGVPDSSSGNNGDANLSSDAADYTVTYDTLSPDINFLDIKKGQANFDMKKPLNFTLLVGEDAGRALGCYGDPDAKVEPLPLGQRIGVERTIVEMPERGWQRAAAVCP